MRAKETNRVTGGLSVDVGDDDDVNVVSFFRSSFACISWRPECRNVLPFIYCVRFSAAASQNTLTHFALSRVSNTVSGAFVCVCVCGNAVAAQCSMQIGEMNDFNAYLIGLGRHSPAFSLALHLSHENLKVLTNILYTPNNGILTRMQLQHIVKRFCVFCFPQK